MPAEQPKEFKMKDLFIDVKLEACVNGNTYDFLGRKLFSAQFFRQNIGFGITNIDIEVNTSLQPIVTVNFKDLYGQTIFGGQRKESNDLSKNNESIDYSVLFDWPPPKFLFSFKGYLGKPVTWVLNLKNTTTSFNSSDGSYELKCEFVPNQWGFFADLPFLYLLAVKRLRMNKLGEKATSEQKKQVTSIFDLIKIGKQVEVKTQDTTKEFDGLVKKLGAIKSNMATAISISNLISYGDEIDGTVNNRPVKNFIAMKLPILNNLDPIINSKEKIELRLSDPAKLNHLNTYLLLSIKFNHGGGFKDGFDLFPDVPRNYLLLNVNNPVVSSAKSQTIGFITKNIEYIDDEIKRRVFSTSEKKLEKITIGEIFSQLGKDAAFVMGSILDAGLDGYRGNDNRFKSRNSSIDFLIGESFPLIVNSQGEEVPAIDDNIKGLGINGIDVDGHEMKFVRDFISAISEGIARDLLTDDANESQNDNILKSRINNLEISSDNPYKPFYDNIAINMLVRSGIVGFLTRSNDPNYPGEFGGTALDFFDRDGRQYMEEIAVKDCSNITKNMINSLSDIDAILLKRFCKFILKFYDAEGRNLLIDTGEIGTSINSLGATSGVNGLVDYKVKMSSEPDRFLTFRILWNELKKPTLLDDIDEVDLETLNMNEDGTFAVPSTNGISNAQNALSFVDEATFTAVKIVNNNIGYVNPFPGDHFFFTILNGDDNKKAQEVNSSVSDAELKSTDKDDESFFDLGKIEVPGYVPVNALTDSENNTLNRIKIIEKYKASGLVLDFEELKNPKKSFYSDGSLGNLIWNDTIVKDDVAAQQEASNGTTPSKISIAGEFGYTVCHHTIGDVGVFGLFNFGVGTEADKGISQRIYLRKMCETLLKNIREVDDEKNQIVGSVLGKAGEQESAIYKQMHVLYHQWQSISYSDIKNSNGGLSGNPDEHKNGDKFNVAEKLEEKYGAHHEDFVHEKDLNGVPDGAFVYEYPLQRINGIKPGEKPVKVKDSIINLEPLYKPNGNTTVLNIIQQICTKNNFLFIPIPGNPDYLNVSNIYSPSHQLAEIDIMNFFHVLFTPTPESRVKTKNDGDSLSLSENHRNYTTNSFAIKYGHPDNQIVSNIKVGTSDNKVTAESIVNLQRLVDNENQNKKVTTDCSTLPVLAGRSYTATVDMLGNAQVYPMQFFFLENSPLFGGLYQVMKVHHSITPNDMKTSAEGIRMRFSPGSGYGSIRPITLDTFRDLGELEAPMAIGIGFSAEDRKNLEDVGKPFPTTTTSTATSLSESKKRVVDKIIKFANQAGIKDKNRLFCLLVIAKKEAQFTSAAESFAYSLANARAVFGSRLKSYTDKQLKDNYLPPPYGEGSQEKLANLLYGNRYLNGPNEGYKYRGRGMTQVTFKSNYYAMSNNMKSVFSDLPADFDLVQWPEALKNEDLAIKSLIAGKIKQQFGKFSKDIEFLNSPENIQKSNHGTSEKKKINQKTYSHTLKEYHLLRNDSYIIEKLKDFEDYA